MSAMPIRATQRIFTKTILATSVVIPVAMLLAAPASAAEPTVVAGTGQAAPAGGNYSTFGNPVINDSGQVGFLANLTGGASTQGIFAGAAGSVQAVALQGTAAPAGGNYSTLGSPVINDSGQVGFLANLTGGASTAGVFLSNTAGSLLAVALQGNSTPAGGNYSSFTNPTLNATGQLVFTSVLAGTG